MPVVESSLKLPLGAAPLSPHLEHTCDHHCLQRGSQRRGWRAEEEGEQQPAQQGRQSLAQERGDSESSTAQLL